MKAKTPKVRSAEPRGFKSWFFTWNNPPDEDGTKLVHLANTTGASRYAFQLEKGENGVIHYQGAMEWKSQMRMSTIKRITDETIHLERCMDPTMVYGTKEETRIAGPWTRNWAPPRKPYDILALPTTIWKPWQLSLKTILEEEPDDRTVVWIYEPTGGVGKSAFAKHYCIGGNTINVMGSAHHIKAAIAAALDPDEPKMADLRNIFYDVPRSELVDETALEQIKNGCFFSAKYKSGMVIMPNVHLIVFANFAPTTSKLSLDRWRIYEINSALELKMASGTMVPHWRSQPLPQPPTGEIISPM